MTDHRVVVFRPGALGDTIVAADALAAIRARFPRQTIELVGNAPAASLLRASGLIDVVTPFDSLDVAGLFGRTPTVAPRWHSAELVVLWLNEAEAIGQAFWATGARQVVAVRPHPALRSIGVDGLSQRGRGESPERADSRSRVIRELRRPKVHVADQLVESLRPVGIAPLGAGPTLLAPRWPRAPKLVPEHTVLLHPGSGSPSKNWPAEQFAALASRLLDKGWIVRLLSGPADGDAVRDVRALIRESDVGVEKPPDTGGLADLLASAALYVGNDSGVSHLSARLGVPTVAIFGPTDPREWAPRGPRVSVIDGAGTWPTVDHVYDAARDLTGENARSGVAGDPTGFDARAAPGRRRPQRARRGRES